MNKLGEKKDHKKENQYRLKVLMNQLGLQKFSVISIFRMSTEVGISSSIQGIVILLLLKYVMKYYLVDISMIWISSFHLNALDFQGPTWDFLSPIYASRTYS